MACLFVTSNLAWSRWASKSLPSSMAMVWPAVTVSFSCTSTLLMRAVIFELTSTESTGRMVPVAETVDLISMRCTGVVCTAAACSAACLDW